MANKKGFLSFGLLIKVFAVLLVLSGLGFLIYGGSVFGFELSGILTEEVMIYALSVAGILIFLNSFKGRFFGKRYFGVLIALILGLFGVYLVLVKLGQFSELFAVSNGLLYILLVIYGVYLFIQGFL